MGKRYTPPPQSLANLKPAKRGEVRNPLGINRRSTTLSQAYKFKLGDDVPNDPQKRTFAELLADSIISKAAKGDVHAASEVADRTEGKPLRAEQENQANLGGVTINLIGLTQERAQELLAQIELLEAKNAGNA